VDPAEIGKNAGPTIPLVGDIKNVFEEFNKLEFNSDYIDWINMLDGFKVDARNAKRRRMYQREEDIINHVKEYHGINPVNFIRELSLAMDKNSVYVADVGQNQMWSCSNYVARGGRFMTSGGMGTMGYALPAAMGAKVAAPDRQVVGVCGDGGFQMTMQELATISQYNIPVKLVILKNTVLGLVRQYQHYNYKDRYSVIDLGTKPDLSLIAQAYGIGYLKLDNSLKTDSTLAAFLAEDKSMILEVDVDRDELC
jgi:acetolactate synthase-1/2/3 large subunit